MTLLIVKNISREGPGILQYILNENRIQYEVVDLDAGDLLPEPDKYDAVLVYGGPDSANDTTAKMISELKMVKKTIDLKIPYLGICLGMQALVKACGGSVHANDVKEIGFRGEDGDLYSIDVVEDHSNDPIFSGLENHLTIFHLHGETVSITKEMNLLATGKYCRHQIVKVGDNAYGIQGHFELTPEMFKVWLDNDPELMEMNRIKLQNDFDLVNVEYSNTGKTLFTNFLRIAGILQ